MSALPEDDATKPVVTARQLDEALAATDWALLPIGVEKDSVAAPSGLLSRISLGPIGGDRVVLVPGMTGSKEDFVLMLPLLAAAGYRVEAYDMAGQYESSAAGPENLSPPQLRYTYELFADDLVAVLEEGATPAHVLGYSFAGTIAGTVASLRPELFASLTLMSAPPLSGQALRGFKRIGTLSYAVPGRRLGRPFITALRLNVHRAPADRAEFVRARFELTRPSSVGDILALMKRTPDFAERLRATNLPVLVVTGTGDVWQATSHLAFAERLGANLLVLPTGHSPCETAPHQLAEAMLEFMQS